MSTTQTPPASTAEPPAKHQPVRSLRRVIWRWHFFAGLCVGPILLVVAVTGALFLFSAEIQDLIRADLINVPPTDSPLPCEKLVDSAVAAHPDWTPVRLTIPDAEGRSTAVTLQAPDGEHKLNVYVDPGDGRVLGAVDPDADPVTGFFTAVLKIHRQLFAGTTGRIIVELATGWGLILLLTGMFLWWPRKAATARGVWWPRWTAGRYTLLRDLHSIPAAVFVPILFLMTGTGLFYTLCWGTGAVLVSQTLSELGTEVTMKSAAVNGKDETADEAPAGESGAAEFIPVGDVVRLAQQRFPGRQLGIDFPTDEKPAYSVFAINDFARGTYGPMRSDRLTVAAASGDVIGHESLADNSRFWWHGWVYPLHAGTILGPTTKVLWLLACCVLASLPVTGTWMWWHRRPSGGSGFPGRQDGALPAWLTVLLTLLCISLPVAGVSVLLILAGEWALGRLSRVQWLQT